MTHWIDPDDAGCHTALDEHTRAFEARRANVAALNGTCPHCGQRIPQAPPVTTAAPAVPNPAAPVPTKAANIAHEAPPSGWRDRDPLA